MYSRPGAGLPSYGGAGSYGGGGGGGYSSVPYDYGCVLVERVTGRAAAPPRGAVVVAVLRRTCTSCNVDQRDPCCRPPSPAPSVGANSVRALPPLALLRRTRAVRRLVLWRSHGAKEPACSLPTLRCDSGGGGGVVVAAVDQPRHRLLVRARV